MNRLIDRRLSRLVLSVTAVGIVTWMAYAITPVNATTVGFAYLLLVLAIASTWGLPEAAAASVLATLVFNFYFFEPKLTLTIADPQNWIALFSFLATSLVGSQLSTKARQRASEAVEKQRDLERLYSLGRAILLIDDQDSFPKQLITKLAGIFEMEAVALYERRSGEIYRAGPREFEGMDTQLREAALQGSAFTDAEGKRVITAVRLGAEPVAGLALQGSRMPDSVLQSIANLVAIGLERARTQNLTHEIEVAKRSERLRTTLIDAMAHEFKTPLTSIRAATSSLLSNPDGSPERARQMLKIADEEAARLEEVIDNALDMAQLESERIDVDLEIVDLNEMVREIVSYMNTESRDRRLVFDPKGPLPSAPMDQRLMKLAIKQLVDNALKYSPADTMVTLRTIHSNGTLTLEVTDQGKGIPQSEQAHIFERFYRSPSVQDRVPGSGLGLSIARRILMAHKGELTVRSRSGETTFSLVLPIELAKEGSL